MNNEKLKGRKGHRGRDCMVVGFPTAYAIGAYHATIKLKFC